ncbi:2OG-Fe(II) oxygenase [Flavobacterium sp. Fl-77]|uniref:2OG-Fe(II) oxygenase n=1 Tax=Flavobacterium flavipigmentatum TaxID=2893884 RepID=A0AAJ2VZ35_9FLAO|nr:MULTISPECIES: 2OG-Fe(II) oxygenase [unclassified Flavobacterium]MDX6183473.1 2OG-Fe(II) oxygenase [Flavobacterium sp. Fl-33]MDX6187125.1 2OG-Fe(II) oxygenase [Flavobacterium sp. Fl-77]UFH40145.1 2OG-Fe(II) oxygenase [Flavobacterium sp. F-70]
MQKTSQKIAALHWETITEDLHQKGFALVSNLITDEQCETLKTNYATPTLYRKTVVMERYRFGLGEYKYFDYPLPDLIQTLRTSLYPKLAPIANAWMKALNIDTVFPATHKELLQQCHANNQQKATVLILKYGKGGFNTLHQDLYGAVYFPIQTVLFLNKPDEDFTGGQFVLTEQTPRAQSKAIVLQPKKGDLLIFTTNFRPVKGTKGYYRVNMKHGVSEIHSGERHTLGIIFHDALS